MGSILLYTQTLVLCILKKLIDYKKIVFERV